MVVLISDLLDDPDEVIRGLKHFQFRGIDVIVFHVLDHARDRVPVRARDALRGSRDRAKRSWRCPARCARTTSKEMGGLMERYRRELGACGIDYQMISTSAPAGAGAARVPVDAREGALMLSFLSPLFLAGAARSGADRAPPAEARARGAREVRRRPAAQAARRSSTRSAATCAS